MQSVLNYELKSALTPQVLQTLDFAGEEANRLRHSAVGSEHVFLGLTRLQQGVAANILRNHGFDLEAGRKLLEKLSPPGSPEKIAEIICTPQLKEVLVFAGEEAKKLNHTYIGTEHLLLGLLRNQGVPKDIFSLMGVDINKMRQEILRTLDPNFSANN